MKIASMTKWQLFMLSSSLLTVYPTLSRPLSLFLFCLLLSSCSIDKFLWVSFRVWWKFQIINYVAQFCFSFYAGKQVLFPLPLPLATIQSLRNSRNLLSSLSLCCTFCSVLALRCESQSLWMKLDLAERERRLPTHRKCLYSCCCCCCC